MGSKCWRCGFKQPETFGELVKSWRADKAGRAAGEAAGISAATISRVERGELPDIKTYVALVQAIGVSDDFAFELIRKQLGKNIDAQAEAPAEPAA